MSHHKHFCFYNESGVTRSVVVLISGCVLVASFIAGYFLSLATDTLGGTADPVIADAVRPGSLRALSR